MIEIFKSISASAEVIERRMAPSVLKNQPEIAPRQDIESWKNVPAPGISDSLKRRSRLHAVEPAIVFCVAAVLRLAYINGLQHLVFQNGDAFYFLSGGSNLLQWLSDLLHGHWAALNIGHASATDSAVMRSTALADRLMNDGPVMTAYAAFMHFIAGTVPGSTAFDSTTMKMMGLNAVVDSLSCVFIYAFAKNIAGRGVARLSAALMCFYPAAILNVHSFYSENFCAGILSLWLWACSKVFWTTRPSQAYTRPVNETLPLVGFGVLTGLLMLSKPLFLFIPPLAGSMVAAMHPGNVARALRLRNLDKRLLARSLALLFGLCCVFFPWYCFSYSIANRVLPGVYRSPSFNLFLGNDIHRDGWRAYPFQPAISSNVGVVMRELYETVENHPLELAALEVKKLPRLWSGIWNEYRFSVLGLPVAAQELFHQLILLAAAVGAMLVLSCTKLEPETEPQPLGSNAKPALRTAGIVLISIILAHFAYCLFEPISRYAFSAMPAACLLAAIALSVASKNKITAGISAISASGVLVVLHFYPNLNYIIEWWYHEQNAHIISGLLTGTWAGTLCFTAAYAVARSRSTPVQLVAGVDQSPCDAGPKPKAWTIAATSLLLAGVTAIAIATDREIDQRSKTLVVGHPISREVVLNHELERFETTTRGFLLFDMVADQMPCPLILHINGKSKQVLAVPWLTINENTQYTDVMSSHLPGMGQGLVSQRQWWAVPVNLSDLNSRGNNVLTIAAGEQQDLTGKPDPHAALSPVTIFGATAHRNAKRFIPSLELLSWTKGFATGDHRDGRVYERDTDELATYSGQHFVPNLELVTPAAQDADRPQLTEFVEHATVPGSAKGGRTDSERENNLREPVTYQFKEPRTLFGGNPLSAMITPTPAVLPQELYRSPGCATGFLFQCDAQRLEGDGHICTSVVFSGNLDGKTISWQSPWQASFVQLPQDKQWYHISFADWLPPQMLKCSQLTVRLQITPFDTDMLFLNRRKAARQIAIVKDVRLILSAAKRSDAPFHYNRL